MKKYKLLKDLPTFKAGDVFIAVEGGNLVHENDNVVVYNWHTLDKFPNILTDWFEEIKEPTRWKPEKREKYYYLLNNGDVIAGSWADWVIDQDRFEIGNCFQTEEEAERVVEYLKALATVRSDATTKFVGGNENWYVYFSTEDDSLNLCYARYYSRNGIFGLPYFATEEDARRSIELHKKEWLTTFGVEEE